jgi:hypothetical protein
MVRGAAAPPAARRATADPPGRFRPGGSLFPVFVLPGRIRRFPRVGLYHVNVAEADGEAAVVMAAGVGSAPSEARAGAR